MKKIAVTLLLMPIIAFAFNGANGPVIAHLDPNAGWSSAGKTMPGANVTQILSNGGSVSWYFSENSDGSLQMNVGVGETWGPLIAYPFGQVQFTPTYPESGSDASGWAVSGSQVDYFDGTQFTGIDIRTFGNKPVALFASQGQGWAIAGNNDGTSPLYVSTFNNTTHQWSPLQKLPIAFVLFNNRSLNNKLAVAAAGGHLYILARDTIDPGKGKLVLFSVDNTNKVTQITNFPTPNDAPSIHSALLLADSNADTKGQNIFAFINDPEANVMDAAYSVDSGQTWLDASQNIPVLVNIDSSGTTLINNLVTVPSTSPNNLNIPGGYMYLSSTPSSWQTFSVDHWRISGYFINSISADGQQQCEWSSPPTSGVLMVSCFNFASGTWTRSAPLSLSQYNIVSMGDDALISLGNGKAVSFATDANDNTVALYYNGQSWTVNTITNFGPTGNAGFNQSTESYVNPQNVWLWENVYNLSQGQQQ